MIKPDGCTLGRLSGRCFTSSWIDLTFLFIWSVFLWMQTTEVQRFKGKENISVYFSSTEHMHNSESAWTLTGVRVCMDSVQVVAGLGPDSCILYAALIWDQCLSLHLHPGLHCLTSSIWFGVAKTVELAGYVCKLQLWLRAVKVYSLKNARVTNIP